MSPYHFIYDCEFSHCNWFSIGLKSVKFDDNKNQKTFILCNSTVAHKFILSGAEMFFVQFQSNSFFFFMKVAGMSKYIWGAVSSDSLREKTVNKVIIAQFVDNIYLAVI